MPPYQRVAPPWELSDVPALLATVARRVVLDVGVDVLATVRTDEARSFVAAEALPTVPDMSCRDEQEWVFANDVLEPIFLRLCPPRDFARLPECTIHLIRCREGRVVPTPDEGSLGYAMLLANNESQAYVGDIITVTPHGWRRRWMADDQPTLTALRRRRLRATGS